MSKRTSYASGTPSWVDLTTTDTEGAKAFYIGLFGWTPQDMPTPNGVYTMLLKEGRAVAALSAAGPDQADIPPHWNSYITVDDVEATAAKVTELGGAVHVPPFDVMEAGRMAVLQDPSGAFFCLWQAGSSIGSETVNEHGAFTWSELMTNDVDRCGTFYNRLFDWEHTTNDMPDGKKYTTFLLNGQGLGGMLAITEEMGPVPPHWLPWFGASDCHAAVKRVVELGGKVLFPPAEFPGVGLGAVIQDPQGATFAVITLNEWPE